MRSGHFLTCCQNFCTSIRDRVDDRVSKLNVSRNEAAKGFKDFHVVDEHTEIDFGETVVSFSVPLIRYQIQWGSI